MRIRHVEVSPVRLRLREPYSIQYETVEEATNVFLRVETEDGKIGWGCAAPDPLVTGETPEAAEAALREAADWLRGRDPLRISLVAHAIEKKLPRAPSARAAVDMALHDLLGKAAGLPLFVLMGGYRRSIATSVTIGIVALEETLRHARERVAEGFRILKVKGGKDWREDAEKVIALRRELPPGVRLRFDANQGYTAQEALAFLRRIGKGTLEILEQPTPARELLALQEVTRKASLPVMADESLLSLRDSFRIAARSLADMVNIKLMKVGGLVPARKANAVAEAGRLETMVGCMDESRVAIAAGLHFALAHRNVEFADLDGHLDLLDDPATGAPLLKAGRLSAPNLPGLGVDVKL